MENYQLYAVLKALEMPRVALLLADDVGLGKTIQAGLILTEMIARFRIRRVLVVCPASLQLQWRDEMRDKFGLDFKVIDRESTLDVQREFGMDANPWAMVPKVITSMDYLRQPDVLRQFLASSGSLQRGTSLPWDLLIVDEAHNLAPLSFTERSDRSEMLREIVPHFEHRLFLTATPHNGYTVSFSGLLELLDPVRFRQKAELNETDHRQVRVVMVRRLKSELNRRSEEAGLPPPFAKREVKGIPYQPAAEEQELTMALQRYRQAGLELLRRLPRRERGVGRFIFSLLTKRLLSSPYAFAKTWWEHVQGFELEGVELADVELARRRAETSVSDDDEMALREQDAVRQGGGWLTRYRDHLVGPADGVNAALRRLGLEPEALGTEFDPRLQNMPDGKWQALQEWIRDHLLLDGCDFRDEDRLVLFTEYKDTATYLLHRLERAGFKAPRVRLLFGGSPERELIKKAFNDPEDPLRILVATDVASEGINLQTACRYVMHYEIPWNPMRMEQRNGRVDRYGQARDVTAFHFFTEGDDDLAFLDHVVRKVNQIREDLGSVGQVIDEAVVDHFSGDPVDVAEFERRVEEARRLSPERRDLQGRDPGELNGAQLAPSFQRDVPSDMDITPHRLARLLQHAVTMEGGQLGQEPGGVYRLLRPPPGWERLVDETVRIQQGLQARAMPRLVFDSSFLEERVDGRTIFRPRSDTILLRLAHPLMRAAVEALRSRLWDDSGKLHRWTITGAADLVDSPIAIVYVLLRVVNALRETVHAELLPYPFVLGNDGPQLSKTLPAVEESERLSAEALRRWHRWLADRWPDTQGAITSVLDSEKERFESLARRLLAQAQTAEINRVRQLYGERISELSQERGDREMERLRRELAQVERQLMQLTFDPELRQQREERHRLLSTRLEQAEWEQHNSYLERLRRRLERERERLLNEVLPQRFTLARIDMVPAALHLLVPLEATP
jgi:superfamily II DNA or RNA helicase